MKRILLIMTLALLGACASKTPSVKLYNGPDRPDSQLVTVRVPMELEVMMINDRRIEAGSALFTYGERKLMLTPGSYRIVAYYKNLWQLSADEHEVVKSDPAVFAVDGNAGDVFRLGFDQPANVDEAKAMAENFTGYVENVASGNRVAGEPSGLVLNQGFVGLVSAGAAAVTEAKASTVAPEMPATPDISAPATDAAATAPAQSSGAAGVSHLDLMKAQWSQATAEERRAFLQWVSQPAP